MLVFTGKFQNVSEAAKLSTNQDAKKILRNSITDIWLIILLTYRLFS